MRIFPQAQLLRWLAAWTAFAVLVVALPWLGPAALGAAVILAALVAWDIRLLRAQPAIELERRLPERVFVGRPAEVTLLLRNPGLRHVEAAVSEDLPASLGSDSPSYSAIPVDAGATTTIRYTVVPRRRGDARFGAAVVLQRSPLGFLRRRLLVGDGAVARIYPDVSRFLRPEALDPKLVFAAIGVKPQRVRGEGMEFESLRDYVPGDDPRRIHWGASARRGRAVTRLTQHEKHHTIVVAVDASRLMASRVDERTKLDFAADAALALAYGALTSGDRLGMALFDAKVRGYIAPRAHKKELALFVEFLRDAEPELTEASYGALAGTLAARQRQRALVVVLTDFVDVDAGSFIAPLVVLGRRHRVLLVAIRDRIYRGLDTVGGTPTIASSVWSAPLHGARQRASVARGGASQRHAPRSGALHGSAEGLERLTGQSPVDLYRRLVLDDLLHEREQALLTLRRSGVQTLDLPPEQITAGVLNRYLQLRHGPEW